MDLGVLRPSLSGAQALIHVASLHAPHVGLASEAEFRRVNVAGLVSLVREAKRAGVQEFVYTSTTALYGDAISGKGCAWIDEYSEALPKTIYHKSKLEAEQFLESESSPEFKVRVVRMSRCFPEPAERMAAYRLHRGIDVRDVADAHLAMLRDTTRTFSRYVVSGKTPFLREDAEHLARDARGVLQLRCPTIVAAFEREGWPLPEKVDRVYDSQAIEGALGWRARYGFEEVLRQNAARDLEVLPATAQWADRTTK